MSPTYNIDLPEKTYDLLKAMSYENNLTIGELISEMILQQNELQELDVNLTNAPDSFELLDKDDALTNSDAFKDEFNES